MRGTHVREEEVRGVVRTFSVHIEAVPPALRG